MADAVQQIQDFLKTYFPVEIVAGRPCYRIPGGYAILNYIPSLECVVAEYGRSKWDVEHHFLEDGDLFPIRLGAKEVCELLKSEMEEG